LKYTAKASLPSGSRVARLSLVLLLTLAAVSLRAQNQPTFRTGANYVRVDMYASQGGQPIEDLKAEDVELLEDGVPQTIDAFEHVSIRPAGSQDSRIEPSTVAQSRQMAAAARARVFVIFLDTYHTQIEGSSNMRLPLIKFLDRVLGPDDMVAVMTPEMSASEITFGRKTTVISNIMQNEWAWGRRGRTGNQDPKDDLYDACYPPYSANSPGPAPEMKARRHEKLTLDALADLVAHLNGVREERKAILTVSEGWALFKENPGLTTSPKGRDQTKAQDLLRPPRPRPDDTGDGPRGANRVECEADRAALAAMDHSLRLRALTEDANRSNVTFYSVYARGIVPFDAAIGSDKAPNRRRDAGNLASRQDSLRFLADNTDGLSVVNTNNIDGLIGRIVDDLSSYYLMGYYSSNTKLDGRFREIVVRVKREGAKVRARRGYRGRTAEELVSTARTTSPASGEGASSALTTVAGFNPRAPFRIRTSSWVHDAGSGEPQGAFWIVGELDYQTRRQLAWTAGAEAEVVVLAADGTQVVSRTVDLNAGDGPFGIQVPESGGLPSGEYAVRVRLRSQADEKVELSDTARVVMKQSSGLGEAVIWRRGPSTGPQYMRTADLRFQRSDRLRLEMATTVTSPAKARLLDRNGNPLSVPVQISERPDPSTTFKWIVTDATLSPLAPGDYAVEVTQGDARQVTSFRLVP